MAERYIDAAFSDGVSTATFFLADQYVVYDYGTDRVKNGVHASTEFPVGASSGFPQTFMPSGSATSLDAALRGKGPFVDFAYFFLGANYMRLRTNTTPAVFDPITTTSLSAWNLPAGFSSVDAAFNGALNREAFCYFFKGRRYVRYIWTNGVDANYPKPISNMVGIPAPFTAGIDAAVDGAGAFADAGYFFKDDTYLRFQWVATGEPHAVLPAKTIQGNWSGLAELLLAGKAKSRALEWLRLTRDRLNQLIAGTLPATNLPLMTLALQTHFHILPNDTTNLAHIRDIFQKVEGTLRDSARTFRFKTDAEAIADRVPQIDAAYPHPWPPNTNTGISFTRNFPRRSEINRVSSVIHEAVHIHEPTSDTPARHINEWYVSPALAPVFGLTPIIANNSRFATRYDLMPASDAVHNPASYATFARHLFVGADTRENP
jgi:hemopexin